MFQFDLLDIMIIEQINWFAVARQGCGWDAIQSVAKLKAMANLTYVELRALALESVEIPAFLARMRPA
jgi:hypothetical protein